MRSLLLAACLALAACSSGDSDPRSTPGENTGPCEARAGSYLVHYSERPGGTCGSVPDSISVLPGSSEGDPACKGSQVISDDQCTITSDLTCTGTGSDAGQSAKLTGKVVWSEDASRAEGTLQIVDTSSAPCNSIYDVTWTRQ